MRSSHNKYFLRFLTLTAAMLLTLGPCLYAATWFQEEEAAEGEEALTQEEYEESLAQSDAYMAAIGEEDPLKRGEMLRGFISKYPKSALIESHIKPSYTILLTECYQNQKFEELEALSEKWLELYPDNQQTISFAATAAAQLKHNDKYLKYLLELYKMQPNAGTARAIAQLYDQMGNFDKYIEWCETTFTYPEFKVDYTLRYEILRKYADDGNVAKATEYAKKTLDVIDAADQPDAEGKKIMQGIRRECYHVIAISLYEEQKYSEAMKYFERALKIEKFQDGFYYIAQCYWRLGDPETAHDYFAAAELLGGTMTEKAKEYKEELYKTLHNDTLIGIEKVHKRAQTIIDSYSASEPGSAQKKTEPPIELNS